MAKQNDKVRDVAQRLEKLRVRPSKFDQKKMAERVELARLLCDDAYNLFQRKSGRPVEEKLWKDAAALFHQTVEEAYPISFWEDVKRLSKGDASGLESAIVFLEIDPWFFRSGYVKADLARLICRFPLSTEARSRLQKTVLAAIDLKDRREFRWYCKLAKKVASKELLKQVAKRLSHEDAGVRRRARWALSAMTHNKAFHIARGKQEYQRENFAAAIGHFSRAIVLEPASVTALLGRGMARCRTGDLDNAIADFDRVIELSASQYVEKCNYKHNGQHLMWMPVRNLTEDAGNWRQWAESQRSKEPT